jgi:acyl-CoA thioesterase-2
MRTPENLAEILALEAIEVNLFRGVSPNDGFPRIFGGLVIAQALMAAYRTVPDRICHSLHAYFIRPGDVNAPVLYEVERARDGGTFTTRRVAAIQHGEQIFNLAASFQTPEEGLEHQSEMPDAPDPESLPTEGDYLRSLGDDLHPRFVKMADFPDRWTCAGSIPSIRPSRFPSPRPSRSGCGPRRRSATMSACSSAPWPTPRTWPSWKAPCARTA